MLPNPYHIGEYASFPQVQYTGLLQSRLTAAEQDIDRVSATWWRCGELQV